jgi:hypothetical protein
MSEIQLKELLDSMECARGKVGNAIPRSGDGYERQDRWIVKDPDILGETPVFRGTRVPLQARSIRSKPERRWSNSWKVFLL